jgi:hypothetical protein
MQTKKMSLANVQGKMSRAEMKEILGGYVLPKDDTVYCNDGTSYTHPDKDCSCGTSSSGCAGHGGFKECLAYGHI